ncbi:nucleotide pyrophosphohydrolase [Pseudonocardia yunnanensis]|uniref:Nucleotide pyrophosphohydrolase n=1 Tax=Pseudonocardia yunnanensis TaxID=58107 RepID=A0ABW4FD86_9PSEU
MRDFEDLADRLRAFAAEREWETFHSPKNLAMALAGEVGELAAELQWLSEADAQPHRFDDSLRQRLADEVADVLIYLVRFADVCRIDLFTEAYAKIGRNESRYPVELSRGNAVKYTSLPGHDRHLGDDPPTGDWER